MPNKYSFKGGVHPMSHGGKDLTKGIAVTELIPDYVTIPMAMHIGAPSNPCVKKGDKVLMGQVIGEPMGFLGLPVHASVSGTVTEVALKQQMGAMPVMCVTIENDYNDTEAERKPLGSVETVDSALIIPAIKAAGVCGMGGATFPTHVKLSVPEGKYCDTIIINGAECETHLTSDHRLMLEQPRKVVDGLRAVMRAMNVANGIIAIEDNKPDAIAAISEVASSRENVKVAVLKTKYPQGSEKQLITAITGREVPSKKLPIDVHTVVINAATAAAISDAVSEGRPLISRITTVTGHVEKPSNLLLRVGTEVSSVIGHCGGYSEEAHKIIMGGTMTGFCAPNDSVNIVKGSGGIIVMNEKEARTLEESPCIRCGRCADVCPMYLNPYILKRYCDNQDIENAKKFNVEDCILCGSCSFICPARRHLTASFKYTKDKIAAIERGKQK